MKRGHLTLRPLQLIPFGPQIIACQNLLVHSAQHSHGTCSWSQCIEKRDEKLFIAFPPPPPPLLHIHHPIVLKHPVVYLMCLMKTRKVGHNSYGASFLVCLLRSAVCRSHHWWLRLLLLGLEALGSLGSWLVLSIWAALQSLLLYILAHLVFCVSVSVSVSAFLASIAGFSIL